MTPGHMVTSPHDVVRYWQMTSEYSAYPTPFSDHKSVGILWSTKVIMMLVTMPSL